MSGSVVVYVVKAEDLDPRLAAVLTVAAVLPHRLDPYVPVALLSPSLSLLLCECHDECLSFHHKAGTNVLMPASWSAY